MKTSDPSSENDYLLDLANEAETDEERTVLINAYNAAELKNEMAGCTNCGLRKNCSQVVPWSGPFGNQPLCFVQDAPSDDDDLEGSLLVGLEGRLFDKALELVGVGRENVSVVSLVSCRVPGGTGGRDRREVRRDELESCAGWLDRQIEVIDPWMIVCLGRSVLGSMGSMGGRGVRGERGEMGLSLQDHHGKIFKIREGASDGLGPASVGRWASSTYHPKQCLLGKGGNSLNMMNLKRFEEDMKFFGQVYGAHVLMGAEFLDLGIEREIGRNGYGD